MKDSLGDRIKEFYENRTRIMLPRRTYIVIRVDGRAFHTYTKGLERPFDEQLMEDMDITAMYLCANIEGSKLAFVQSDEISLILTDFDKLETQGWFDNSLQKMCSVSASLATAKFNELRVRNQFVLEDVDARTTDYIGYMEDMDWKLATFDSRVFQIPYREEVINYLIWRQQDASRNSIQSVAQSLYSHKQLNGKNSNDLQEMIFQKGINWNDLSARKKRGRVIAKIEYDAEGANRSKWIPQECPVFTQDRQFLYNLIPNNDGESK